MFVLNENDSLAYFAYLGELSSGLSYTMGFFKTLSFHSLSPCIMCVQYIGGCSVHRGVFSTLGGYHEYIGGYHEYIGGIP